MRDISYTETNLTEEQRLKLQALYESENPKPRNRAERRKQEKQITDLNNKNFELENKLENSILTEAIEKEIENIKEEYKHKYKRMKELENTIGMSIEEYKELKNLWVRVNELDIKFTTLIDLLKNK